jgi:alpha-methylacyl-CoA racemase
MLSALFERDRSGHGQVVDAAMVDGAVLLTTFLHGMRANGLWAGERGAVLRHLVTSDGKYMAVGCVEPQFYAEFLNTLGIAEPGLPFQLDPGAWPEMKKLIGDAFGQKTRAEWTDIFADSDACVTPVLSPWEAHEHPHNQARDAFVDVDGVLQPAPAPRFSRSANARPLPADSGGRDLAKPWGPGV